MTSAHQASQEISIDGPILTTLRASSLQGPHFRLDAKHYQEEFVIATSRVTTCGYPSIVVKMVANAYVAKRTKLFTVESPRAGAPYLRAHGAFNTRPESQRFLSRARMKDYQAYVLEEGMILTPSSGRNLGPLTYVGKKLAEFAMTDIIRITPFKEDDAFYLLAYLMTPTGQALIRRGRTGTTVDHLSPEDVLTIPVVWPAPATRDELGKRMKRAEAMLDQARLRLDALERQLHDVAGLDIEVPQGKYFSSAGPKVFSVRSDALDLRLDAAYYDPTVVQARKALKKHGLARLDRAAKLVMLGRYKRYYVGERFGRPILSGRQLLQLRPVNLRYISDRSFENPDEFILRKGWTVFTCDGRAEEGLGSPAFVHSRWDGWMASNHVMRAVSKGHVPPGYLYLALRSPYTQLQLKARATGSVIDAIDPASIGDVLIPTLDPVDMKRLGEAAEEAWENIAKALSIQDAAVHELEELIIRGYEDVGKRTEPVSPPELDPYVTHSLYAAAERSEHGVQSNIEDVRLPILIRVRDANWSAGHIPDFAETSRMGDIIACQGTLRTLKALQSDPDIVSIEASRPSGEPECSSSVPLIRADVIHNRPLAERGDAALVAVIDLGIDVLHEAFRDVSGTRTRILAVWDQRDPTGPAPQDSNGQDMGGTLHSEADINRYVQHNVVPARLVLNTEHGTHVASIAAGRPTSQFFGGVAPEAKIIVVIPALDVGPDNLFSLGYSSSHVAALRFIREFALARRMPVVVNASIGMNAGAHDGKSLLEIAFDNFSSGGRDSGFVIVKSAGNERSSNRHSKLVMGSHASEILKWKSKVAHPGPDVIELWFSSWDSLRFRLHSPSRTVTPWVDTTTPHVDGVFPRGNRYRITYTNSHIDNGDSRLLITIHAGPLGEIKVGTWTLEINSDVIESNGEIHAWLERDRMHSLAFKNHVNEEVTLSIPGTAMTVITVGSVDKFGTHSVALTSSYGPTRDGRKKPELSAPGEAIIAARAHSGTDVIPKSGTSMAAPHVTGAIALLLSYQEKQIRGNPNLVQLSAAQIRTAITRATQNFNRHWNRGQGYGVLDIEALLARF